MMNWRRVALLAIGGAVTACSDEALVPVIAPCAATVSGECVGLPAAAICEGEICTAEVACATIVEVASDAALQAAAPSPGDCIALAPGSYGEVALPGGVSLLGKSADLVTLSAVRLGAGSGAVVRGLAVTGDGISLEGARGVVIDRVRVTGAAHGIQADEGSSFELVDSTVAQTRQNGVVAYDASVTLRRTLVETSAGPGLWLACSDGCGCASRPEVLLDHVALRDNHVIGAALVGVEASLRDVAIAGTQQNLTFGTAGGGLYAGDCAALATAGQITIDGSATFGLLVHDASAGLGSTDDDAIIVINGSEQAGIWLSGIGQSDPAQSVVLDNFTVSGGAGVGLGFGIDALGIIVINGTVEDTTARQMPVLVDGIAAGSDTVGHGIIWNAGASAQLSGLTLSGNAVQSLLIDGPVGAGSAIATLVQADGDDTLGVLQQRVMAADASPTIDASATLQQEPAQVASVPIAPTAPSSM